jgi:hypothetical protein
MPKPVNVRQTVDGQTAATPVEKPVSLCATCDHNLTCVYFREHKGAIQFCEEYMTIEAAAPSQAEILPELPSNTASEFKGLCINCQKQATCVFVRPAEGVWHCEEYA